MDNHSFLPHSSALPLSAFQYHVTVSFGICMVSANFAMHLRRCRTRYKDPTLRSPLLHPSQPTIPRKIHPICHAKPIRKKSRRRTSRIPAQHPWSSCHHCNVISPYPSRILFAENIPKFKMLASLQRQLCLRLARCALQSQHNLLRRLCFLVENGLGLTTVTGLFAIITTLSLREQRCLI
jgi:hypothetical protein